MRIRWNLSKPWWCCWVNKLHTLTWRRTMDAVLHPSAGLCYQDDSRSVRTCSPINWHFYMVFSLLYSKGLCYVFIVYMHRNTIVQTWRHVILWYCSPQTRKSILQLLCFAPRNAVMHNLFQPLFSIWIHRCVCVYLYIWKRGTMDTTLIIPSFMTCTVQVTHLSVDSIGCGHGGRRGSSWNDCGSTRRFHSNRSYGISALLPWRRLPADDVAASATTGPALTRAGRLAVCSAGKLSHVMFSMKQHRNQLN